MTMTAMDRALADLAASTPAVLRTKEALVIKSMASRYDRSRDLEETATLMGWFPDPLPQHLPRDRIIARLWEAIQEDRRHQQMMRGTHYGPRTRRRIRQAYIGERLARLRDRAQVRVFELGEQEMAA